MKSPAFVFLLSFLFVSIAAASSLDPTEKLLGVYWNTEKDAKIEVYRCGSKICGKVVWLKEPNKNGQPTKDVNNTDKSKQNRQVMGMNVLWDFSFDGKDRWTGGEAYDPKSGKTYTSYLRLKNQNTLELRGFIGTPMLGRTVIWERAN